MNPLSSFVYESRVRLSYLLWSFVLTFFLSSIYQKEIVYCVGRPFLQFHHPFIFLDLSEALYTVVHLCVASTFLLWMPFLIYHVWCFFLPSFYLCETKWIHGCLLLFVLLFFVEISFIYHIMIPQICHFLLSFEMSHIFEHSTSGGEHLHEGCKTQNPFWGDSGGSTLPPCSVIEIAPRLQSYVQFLEKIFCVFLLSFQLPFVFFLFFQNHFLTAYDLCKNRKNFVFLAFLLAASISPPDGGSQAVLSLCFLFFYENLILLGLFFSTKQKTTQKSNGQQKSTDMENTSM
jgi:sec-independent protein translocase protein TatC